jgi:hypothetical protein
MEKQEQCLSELKRLIEDFLIANGAYPNGYDTTMNCKLNDHTFQFLDYTTPKTDELTGIEKNRRSYVLNDELVRVMSKYRVTEARVRSEYMSDGCSKIYIEIPLMEQLDLYRF